MNCKVCSKLMDEYAAGTLPEEMRAMMGGHLADCGPCRDAVSQYKAVSASLTGSLMNTTGSLRMKPDAEERVLQSLGAEPAELPFEDMMKLFETLSFREKWAKVRYGIKQPKDTGAYKWAALQIKRLISPAAAVLVPSLALLLMVLLAGMTPQRQQVVNVRIADDQNIPELEPPVDIPEPDLQPPDPQDIVEPMDNFIPSTSKSKVGPDVDFSPQPAQFDSVAIIRSPVVMKGIFGSRSPGARGSALGRFGGGGHTEGAVLRALRWLKKHQEEDGCWASSAGGYNAAGGWDGEYGKTTFTAWGLLAFLAHGETPASPEFGATVEKAMKWLVETQGPNGKWRLDHRHDYGMPTAAYALSEAYGMTKLPSLREPAEKAIDVLIKGQQAGGGWTYGFAHNGRLDTSFSGWCVQALKAAQMAGLQNPGLSEALTNARKVFQHHVQPSGWFKYATGGAPMMDRPMQVTGAAVLALQLAGHAQSDLVRNGLKYLEGAEFNWQKPSGENPVWGWYYITQAKFHEGGETWRDWNKKFSIELVNNQTVVPKAIAGPTGKMEDIGYWPAPDRVNKSYIYGTTLNALQLMVYYRYLPTFQKPEDIIAADGGDAADRPQVVEAQDLDIDIQL